MLGFAWLEFRQAREALKRGRLEEAHRLLSQPSVQCHKRYWELLVEVARGFAQRAEEHRREGNLTAAWNDLVTAEQVGGAAGDLSKLRQTLVGQGIEEAQKFLDIGEPSRAAEVLNQLRGRSAEDPKLTSLEDAAKGWALAREQANRGDFASAIAMVERIRRLFPRRIEALEQFIKNLEQKHQAFTVLLVQLHQAMDHKDWREVVRLAERVLAMAPQHSEARKARSHAWRAIEPETQAGVNQVEPAVTPEPVAESDKHRFFLWIDGVGGYLVCLGSRVTIGQATPDAYVDIPLFADVSRQHATLVRDAEGYMLEATRPLMVNGHKVDRTLLQNGDRVTLGTSCQLSFVQAVPVSTSARIEVVSGHRLPLTVEGVLLMADTLVLGPGPQAHVVMPELDQPLVLYRQKDGLAMRSVGNFIVDGESCRERAALRATSSVTGENFAFALEPAGTGSGRM
jgi:tetratricopeptide (TPR) repeat protein